MQVQTSHDCDVAMVMTNSTFTRQARELADKLGVELWEHCSPNGSSSVISRLMRIFNLFFLTIGLCMCASARLLNFPEGTIRTYMNLLMLILASLSALLGWNHFLPCILSGMLYFGIFLWTILPLVLTSDSNWYGILMLLPAFITIGHALYARFRNQRTHPVAKFLHQVHVRLSSFEYGLHSPRKTQGHFPHRL